MTTTARRAAFSGLALASTVAILAGWQSVAAVFVASTVLEIVRSFSSAYFRNTWQLALGLFLLFVIRFLPRGIGSLWTKKSGR